MDAAAIGAVIGIGIIICAVGTYSLCEKRNRIKKSWRKFLERFRSHKGKALLPLVQENPMLVRSASKQFQMKDLL